MFGSYAPIGYVFDGYAKCPACTTQAEIDNPNTGAIPPWDNQGGSCDTCGESLS